MRNPLSKRIVEIEPSGIRKFFDIVNEMEDAISLGVGEPDFDTPWHIRDEGIFSLEKGRTSTGSPASLKLTKLIPFTTLPLFTSKQGMILFVNISPDLPADLQNF